MANKYNGLQSRSFVEPNLRPSRFVRNLVDTDFSNWGDNDIPNTGDGSMAVSTTQSTGDTLTISTVTPGLARCFKGKTSVTLSGSKYYAFGCELDATSSGTFSGTNLSINHTPASGTNAITMLTPGRYAFVFQPASTTAIGLRVGQGASSDTTLTGGETMVIKNVFLYEVSQLGDAPPEYVPYPSGISFPYDQPTSIASNVVTESAIGTVSAQKRAAVVLTIADSYGNDNNDFPAQLNIVCGREVWNDSTAGFTMVNLLTTFNNWVATSHTRFPYTNSPKVVIFGGCVNDIFGDNTLGTLQTRVQALVAAARANNMIPIVYNCPPFGAYASYTAGRQTVAESYNAWLATVTDFFVVDIFSLMRDKTTAFNLDALYNVGDGLHPNTAGSVMIANAINAVLTQIDNVVDK